MKTKVRVKFLNHRSPVTSRVGFSVFGCVWRYLTLSHLGILTPSTGSQVFKLSGSNPTYWFPNWFCTVSQPFPVSLVHFGTGALTSPALHHWQGSDLLIITVPCACVAPLPSLPGPFCARIIPQPRRPRPPSLHHCQLALLVLPESESGGWVLAWVPTVSWGTGVWCCRTR